MMGESKEIFRIDLKKQISLKPMEVKTSELSCNKEEKHTKACEWWYYIGYTYNNYSHTVVWAHVRAFITK